MLFVYVSHRPLVYQSVVITTAKYSLSFLFVTYQMIYLRNVVPKKHIINNKANIVAPDVFQGHRIDLVKNNRLYSSVVRLI